MADSTTPAISIQSPVDSIHTLARSPPEDGVILNRDGTAKGGALAEARTTPNGKPFGGKLIRSLSGNPGSNTYQPGTEGRRQSGSGPIDPIGKQIQQRNTQNGVFDESALSDGTPTPTSASLFEAEKAVQKLDAAGAKDTKKNRASFLSRFMTKKKDSFDTVDDEDDPGDKRAEGANAETFSQPIGYMPKYPEPPKYIKVRARGKKEKTFDRVFLAQELRGRTGVEVAQAGGRKINPAEKAKLGAAVWALEFSKDGRFLAAGGHDHLVRVWAVLETEEERRAPENHESTSKDGVATSLSAPVFKCRPVQEYEGHTSTIVALTWSKNNFLLSSSMDKTVRLWHVSRSECLCAFKHSDFVTSIQFHPKDDRFFLAGSMDSKLRLWSIPDKTVAHWTQCNEIITSVAFTPDGKISIAGCLSGVCIFYETEGFRQQTQMHVRSAHGRNAKGSKITGIQAINSPPSDPNGEVKLLITSNDSRIRLYNFRDKGLELKLKGAENSTSQIRANFSDDGRYIITGSEDKKAYIWSTEQPEKNKDKWPVETFEAHTSIVTAAIMAPARTRQLLQQSGDPLFDICNPPPVQLVSRAESRSSYGGDANESRESISAAERPGAGEGGQHQARPRPEDNPGWLARSSHPNGNIIVTADFEGHIKVFRQDCAHKQRLRNNENWDSGSTFSKKLHLHRSSSITTRNSMHSARDLAPLTTSDRHSGVFAHSPFLAGGPADSVPPPSSARRNFSRSISPSKSSATTHSPALGSLRTGASTPHIAGTPTAATSSSPSLHRGPSSAKAPSASSSQSRLQQFHPRPAAQQSTAQQGAILSSAPQGLAVGSATGGLFIAADGTSDALFQREAYEAQAATRPREGTVDLEEAPIVSLERQRQEERSDAKGAKPQQANESQSSLASGSSVYMETASDDEDEDEDEPDEDDEDGERCERCGGDNFRLRRKGSERTMECVTCGKVAR